MWACTSLGMDTATITRITKVKGSILQTISFTIHTGGSCDVELESRCMVNGAHDRGFIRFMRDLGIVDTRISSHAFVPGASPTGLQVALNRLVFPGSDRKFLVGVLWRNRLCADLQSASQTVGIVRINRSTYRTVERKWKWKNLRRCVRSASVA